MISKVLIWILILSSIPLVSRGRTIRQAGAKLGGAFSTLANYNDNRLDVDRVWGVDGGVFIEWLDMPTFSLVTEVHLLQKGATFINKGTYESGGTSPRTDGYLSIPVMGKIRLGADAVIPYFLSGPRVDFLVTSTGKSKTVDIGVTLALGIEIPSTNDVVFGFEFRFSPSFNSLYPSGARNTSMEFLFVVAPS